jgi:hypothetical protein
MTIDLTRDEIWFLKVLRAAGERGRIVSALASRAGLARFSGSAVRNNTSPKRAEDVVRDHRSRPTGSCECAAINERAAVVRYARQSADRFK